MDSLSAKFTPVLKRAGISASLESGKPLVPEASTRRYYRLTFPDGKTLIGVHEDMTTAKVNFPLVLETQKFLKHNTVAVPEILFTDADSGTMLQQDLGDLSLHQALRNNPHDAESFYQEAISHMLRWQRSQNDSHCPAFSLSFDMPKLMFEFDFFIAHTLQGYYKKQLSNGDVSQLREDFSEIAETLAAPTKKVFTHRDYHSRNIMICDGRQYIIDFQDARLGLLQYDLCSLLFDAYAPIEKPLRTQLLDFAYEQGREIHQQSRSEFDRYIRLSAFQRVIKAMGTFGRQAVLGRSDFAAYLEPAWQMLAAITSEDKKLRSITFKLESLLEDEL